MTGIPTVSDPVCLLYELTALCCIAGFAAYDLKKKRVPDRALVFFCPLFLAAPLFRCGSLFSVQAFLPVLGLSITGMASGFFVLLAAALISHDGTGIGGGDIKLAALMGYSYGSYRFLAILLIAEKEFTAVPAICSISGSRQPDRNGCHIILDKEIF